MQQSPKYVTVATRTQQFTRLSIKFVYDGDESVSNATVNFNTNVTDSKLKCSASELQAFRGFKTAYCSVGVIEVRLNGNCNDVKTAKCLYDSFVTQKFLNSEGRVCSSLSLFIAGLLSTMQLQRSKKGGATAVE